MICPIVSEGQGARQVWLPKGRWKHFFSGEYYDGDRALTLSCPLDEIIVLERINEDDKGRANQDRTETSRED